MNVVDDERERRFVASGEDGEGFLTYQVLAPGLLELDYIEVPLRYRGTGVAGRIVAAVCEQVRAAGARVVPTCPYIVWWFARHPAEHDLLHTPDSHP